MRLVVFSDVHSNIYALNAVLKDIEARGINNVICAGDLVGYAPFPNEVVEVIRAKNIPTVMGNYDDGVAFHRIGCGCDYPDEEAMRLGEASLRWTKEHISDETREFLWGLPKELSLQAAGRQVLVVHGSPRRLNEYLYEDVSEEYLKELLDESGTDVLICAHTHKPYHRLVAGKHVINVGSVGKPKHGNPNAMYAVVNLGKSVSVELIEVPYDFEATARAIEAAGLPGRLGELIRAGKA